MWKLPFFYTLHYFSLSYSLCFIALFLSSFVWLFSELSWQGGSPPKPPKYILLLNELSIPAVAQSQIFVDKGYPVFTFRSEEYLIVSPLQIGTYTLYSFSWYVTEKLTYKARCSNFLLCFFLFLYFLTSRNYRVNFTTKLVPNLPKFNIIYPQYLPLTNHV